MSCQSTASEPKASIAINGINYPETEFARDEIIARASRAGYSFSEAGDWTISFNDVDSNLGEQCYTISVGDKTITISGGDDAGLMYGGLEVAEQIALYGIEKVQACEGRPYILERGTKNNIPLDMRTPSYTDAGTSAQENIDDMWDIEFWHEYIDELARNRYNAISIWSLNPFPSMVKVPEYPDIALDDVWRTTIPFDETYNGTATNMVRPEHWENYEVVKEITIDEKIEFWREVMQYAHDRGMKFYIYTWNVYTYGEQGKYGIDNDIYNPVTVDYFRCSAREMVKTYPLLDGIGITAGENMVWSTDDIGNEMWLWNTYGEGITEALNEEPGREFKLLHRLHLGEFDTILDVWKDFPGQIEFSDKYSIAHMYAYPHPNFIDEHLEILPEGERMYLEVRNDDMYNLIWGDIDYAREYLEGMPSNEILSGFFLGSDGYVQGREVTAKEALLSGDLFIKKHWINFMLFGRLAYDNTLPEQRVEDILETYYGRDGNLILETLRSGGKTVPLYNRLLWFDTDFWYAEGNYSKPESYGYYSAKNVIRNKNSQPGSGVVSVYDTVKAKLGEVDLAEGAISAYDIVDQLREYGDRTLELVKQLESQKKPRNTSAKTEEEFERLVKSQKAWGYLALYYAEKITGALNLRLYNDTGDASYHETSVESYTKGLEFWKQYAALFSSMFKDETLGRIGYMRINEITDYVSEDIEIAKTWKIRPLP